MSFQSFLGNEQLKKNLAGSLAKGHISHFYLISGPRGSGKHTLARLLAAAILCTGSDRPCLHCGPCRKVMEGTHPDFITVDDPEKKTVTVELVRSARADMYIQPNESDHKIYLFPRAQDMRLEGQNALLKVLEEPPAYGVFLLLTDNPDKLLPTVRSRCTELKLNALPREMILHQLRSDFPSMDEAALNAAAARSGGYLGQAREILESGSELPPQTEALMRALCTKDTLALLHVLVPMERWKRDALIPLLQSWLELTEEALSCRCGGQAVNPLARELAKACSTAELLKNVGHFQKAVDYTTGNVSPAAICGQLEWALRR